MDVKKGKLEKETAIAFWASFADPSRITSPVTAASLKASERDPFRSVIAFLLIVLVTTVVLFSVYLFANTSMTNQISQMIDEQNKASLRLWSHTQYFKNILEPMAGEQGVVPRPSTDGGVASGPARPPAVNVAVARVTPDELFTQVVEFARMNVALRQTAWQYNKYFFVRPYSVATHPIDFGPSDPGGLTRVHVDPGISKLPEVITEAIYQIVVYQRIRDFAEASYKGNLVLWNGITAYLLPAIYALLGAGLHDLRSYAEMARQKRHLGSPASYARYLIAFIVGAVVSLFSSLFPQHPSVSPLAVAFLLGYSVEAFFSRLDGFMKRVQGDEAAPPPQVRTAFAEARHLGKVANE